MVKFKSSLPGGHQQLPPDPGATPTNQVSSKAKVQANRPVGKMKAAQIHAPIDATESSNGDRTQTEGLRHQVRVGLSNLTQAYYGLPPGEPSFLQLMIGSPEQVSVPDHVITHHAKGFEQDLKISREKARALATDLAMLLS